MSIPLSQSTHHISIKVSGTVRIPDQAILTWSDAGSGLAPQNPGRRPQAKAELVLESGHSDHRSKVQQGGPIGHITNHSEVKTGEMTSMFLSIDTAALLQLTTHGAGYTIDM